MNRGEFILKTSVGLASIATLSNLLAEEHHHSSSTGSNFSKLKQSVSRCIISAEDCISHCIKLMGKGDKSLEKCASASRDVIAACQAFLTLISNESSFSKKMAGICIEICESCIAECKKHASKHEACKTCMEACKNCIQEIKSI